MNKIIATVLVMFLLVSNVMAQSDISTDDGASFNLIKWIGNFFEAGVITEIDGQDLSCDYEGSWYDIGTDDDGDNDGDFSIACHEEACSFEVVEAGRHNIIYQGIVRDGEVYYVDVSEPNQWDIHWWSCTGVDQDDGGTDEPCDYGDSKCDGDNIYYCDNSGNWYLEDTCQSGYHCEVVGGVAQCQVDDDEACDLEGESCLNNPDTCCGAMDCVNGVCVGQSEGECIESDNGKDYNNFGSVSFGGDSDEDNCASPSKLQEYYCVSDNVGYSSELVDCQDNQICRDGACVEPTVTGDCEDPDGRDYETRSTVVTYNGNTKTDTCYNGKLLERVCEDTSAYTPYNTIEVDCSDVHGSYVCYNGACVDSDVPPNPPNPPDLDDCVSEGKIFQTEIKSDTGLKLFGFEQVAIDIGWLTEFDLDNPRESKDVCCEDSVAYYAGSEESSSGAPIIPLGWSVFSEVEYKEYKCMEGNCPQLVGSLPAYVGMEPDCTMGWIMIGAGALLLLLLLK